MTDVQFLIYCQSMARTERCGFVPANLARLCRLAGEEHAAAEWDAQPVSVISHCHDYVRTMVACAKDRAST